MKRISAFGYDLELHAEPKGNHVSLEDIRQLNDETVRYLRGLPKSELDARVASVTVSTLADDEAIKATLDRYGIVIVPDFIGRESIDQLEGDVAQLRSIISTFTDTGQRQLDTDRYLIQRGAAAVSGYDRLASHEKPVIQIRDGQDAGMVDVFNIDHLLPTFSTVVRGAYEASPIAELIGSDSENLTARNLNVYMNADITATRGFHVDDYRKKLKSFIYLTDVETLDDGPYTYVKGSHVESPFRRINRTLSRYLPNRTEAPIVPLESIVPAIARKGTLVISDQGGFHRGFPQARGHSRMLSVMNYK